MFRTSVDHKRSNAPPWPSVKPVSKQMAGTLKVTTATPAGRGTRDRNSEFSRSSCYCAANLGIGLQPYFSRHHECNRNFDRVKGQNKYRASGTKANVNGPPN